MAGPVMPRFPFDHPRGSRLLDRMKMLIAESWMRHERPVRLVFSRDLWAQETSDWRGEPRVFGLPIETRDDLPPNTIILENAAVWVGD